MDSGRNYASSMTYMCVFRNSLVHGTLHGKQCEIWDFILHLAHHWSNDAKVLHRNMPAIILTELNISAICLYNIPMSYIGWNEFKRKKMINHASTFNKPVDNFSFMQKYTGKNWFIKTINFLDTSPIWLVECVRVESTTMWWIAINFIAYNVSIEYMILIQHNRYHRRGTICLHIHYACYRWYTQ